MGSASNEMTRQSSVEKVDNNQTSSRAKPPLSK